MSEVKNIPRLRFPEFSNEWQKYKLKDFATVKRGAGSQYIKYTQNRDEGIRLIRIGDFLDNDPVFVLRSKEIDRFILEDGDILIAGTGATAGITFLVPPEFIGLAYSYNAPRIKVKDNSISFIFYYLKTEIVLTQQQRLFTGNAQPFLDTNAISNFKFSIPSTPEQQKIADFLTAVDKRIELLEKKKTLLETYKKGVMKKIFNQEIRFKDDNGNDFSDWEEKKLGEVCKLQGGYAFKSNSFKDEGIPIIRISNISNDNNYLNLENLVHYDEISNDENFTILKGDLLIAMSGATTGKTSISNYDGKCYLNQRVGLFKSKTDKLNYSYLVQFVYSPVFGSQLIQFLVAGAQPNISSKDIESVTIPFPSIVEQQKISQFLSSIDTQLKLIESQIDKSKTWKKGLLQKMFV